jgi:hypothetical protein
MTTMAENTFSLWLWPIQAARLGVDAIETMLAAQQVISARLPTLAGAMVQPLSADHGELSLMVTEKVAAFGESRKSATAVSDVIRRASAANAKILGTIAGGGVIWPADWLQLTWDNLAACAAVVALPMDMLKPIHVSVVANERRLRR